MGVDIVRLQVRRLNAVVDFAWLSLSALPSCCPECSIFIQYAKSLLKKHR